MPGLTTDWDINLRANLRLWPPSANVAALCRGIDKVWDEEVFSTEYFGPGGGGDDRRRAVRQTYKAMAYEGLVYRDSAGCLRATRLGDVVLSFLGLTGGPQFANEANRHLIAGLLVNGLATILEVRVIWRLILGLGNSLTNEELNRAMPNIGSEEDVPDVVLTIEQARHIGDPTLIGPRIYDEGKFGTASENDQRKAMNPHFLLAGGGGLCIDLGQGERSIPARMVPRIHGALRRNVQLQHAATDRDSILAISRTSLAPIRYSKGAPT